MSVQVLRQTDTTFAHVKIHFPDLDITMDFGPAGAKNDPTGLISARGSLGGPDAEVRAADAVHGELQTNSIEEQYLILAGIMVNVVPNFDSENYNIAHRHCITFAAQAMEEAQNLVNLNRIPGMRRFIDSDIIELAEDLQNNPALLKEMLSKLPNSPHNPDYLQRSDNNIEQEVLTAQQPETIELTSSHEFGQLLAGVELSGFENISFNSQEITEIATPVVNVAQDISRQTEFGIG